ncbi:MAG: methyltransferase [Saprospiraceae bacterium]|nr:methyltransferase [Saprospiraceae bacterium]
MNKGNNLYPQELTLNFGDVRINLDVPEGIWNPTPHGMHLGNMILNLDFKDTEVLEIGSGCGNHTILICQKKPKKLTVTEINRSILDNTRHNLLKNNIDTPVEYMVADWTCIDKGPFDVLISNPPFAKSGKRYYRYFIDTLINDAHKLVKPGGRLIFVQSSMADLERSVNLMKEWGMEVRIVGEHKGPFREYYFEDKIFMRNIEKFHGAYEMIDNRYIETLTVFESTLP